MEKAEQFKEMSSGKDRLDSAQGARRNVVQAAANQTSC